MARFAFSALILLLPLFSAEADPNLSGCRDLRTLTRLDKCAVLECSSKRRDGVKLQMTADRQETIDGSTAMIRYQCQAPATLATISTAMDAMSRASGYAVIYQDSDDPSSRILTLQRGGHWVDIDISTDNSGGVVYTVTGVDVSPQRAANEVCEPNPSLVLPKGCQIAECANKRKEKTEMRRSADKQVAFDGPVHASTLACPSAITAGQVLDFVLSAYRNQGYEAVYTEREQPEYTWLTMRSADKWFELMSFQDGDALAYQLTEVTGTPLAATATKR